MEAFRPKPALSQEAQFGIVLVLSAIVLDYAFRSRRHARSHSQPEIKPQEHKIVLPPTESRPSQIPINTQTAVTVFDGKQIPYPPSSDRMSLQEILDQTMPAVVVQPQAEKPPKNFRINRPA